VERVQLKKGRNRAQFLAGRFTETALFFYNFSNELGFFMNIQVSLRSLFGRRAIKCHFSVDFEQVITFLIIRIYAND
jgi:hypothetical protein